MFTQAKPLGFRKWLTLEKLKTDLIEQAESEAFPDKVFAYLSASLSIPVKRLEKKGWEDTVKSLMKESSKFSPNRELPMLKDAPPKKADSNEPEYENKNWYYYSHLLAQNYGWEVEYISNLEVNDALAYMQEILTANQYEKEFYYGLSEVAYRYNKSTKKSDFVPMKRPYWMLASAKPIKKVKMKRSLLPVGVGVDLSGMPEEYGIQNIIDNGQR